MKRSLLLLVLALVVVGSASARPTQAASYFDFTGDTNFANGADVAFVAVADADAGSGSVRRVAVGIGYANRSCIGGAESVFLFIDTDANPTTGSPTRYGEGSDGKEIMIEFSQQAGLEVFQWWAGVWVRQQPASDWASATCRSTYDQITFDPDQLGIESRFNFVAGTKFQGYSGSIIDRAPANSAGQPPHWSYQMTSMPEPPPPPVSSATYRDAPRLSAEISYGGDVSIKHVRLGEKLYRTMKSLNAPRVVSIACWSEEDWPSVVASIDEEIDPERLAGVFLSRKQPRWVHIAPGQCADVQSLMDTRKPTGRRAFALSTVIHERIHAQGYGNEAQTECYAVQVVSTFARELNFTPEKQVRLQTLALRMSSKHAAAGYWNRQKCRDGGAWDLFPGYTNLKL